MKTIAIFTGYYLPFLGGIERYTSKLSEELISRGYRVIIVTSRHEDLPEYEKKGKLTIYRLPLIGLFKRRYPVPAIRSSEYKVLRKRIDAETIDYILINTRFHLTTLIGGRVARRKRIEPLLIEHGTAHFSIGIPVLDFFGKWYEHGLTAIVKRYVKRFYGVSKKCNEWLQHYRIKASGVFYNAIDPRDAKTPTATIPKLPSGVNVTYAGRLIKEKGVLNLIAAFEKVASVDANLLIAGDGPLYAEITKSTAANPRIILLGKLNFEEMKSLYKQTDIFVHPSLYPEGLPTSILEAALLQCAIIATPKGGTEEVIIDRQHGIIVDGTVASLVRALRSLLKDTTKRRLMAEHVQKRVLRDFTWSAVADRVEEELKEKAD